jgi:hypothetical protein
MTSLQKTIFNCATGETTIRDFTSEELAENETLKLRAEATAKAEADKAATRAAVLTRLGLTSDELLALLS